MDGGAWYAAVHGVARSWTWLNDFTFTFHFHALEKEMATHSSVLAWRIPGTGEPGGLPSMGSHRVGHNWSDLAAAAAWIRISGLFSLVGRGLALQGVSVSTFLNVSLWRCGRMVLFCVCLFASYLSSMKARTVFILVPNTGAPIVVTVR